MADKALLIYGLSDTDALTCKIALSDACDSSIDIISASGSEHETVRSILESPESTDKRLTYIQNENPFVMFLGFTDEEISLALKNFPALTVSRPIFCALTENNLEWTIDMLSEHLREEDQKMRGSAR
jgi:Domain of unknown function (DUF3783)